MCLWEFMLRSQIYITEIEKKELNLLSEETGKSQSELIREAIDLLIQHKLEKKRDKMIALQAVKGLWEDRSDLPDFAKLRREFDRS